MAAIGIYEAKTHFTSIVERAVKGEEITITRHGKPLVKIVRVEGEHTRPAAEVIAEMREIQKRCRLDGLSVREMIEEGRRY